MDIIQIKKPYFSTATLLSIGIGMFLSGQLAAEVAADSLSTAIQSAVTMQPQTNAIAIPPPPAEQFQVTLTRCGNSNALQWGPCHYAIGDTGPAGGFVFYVTDAGLHGMEAARKDQGNAASWGCYGILIVGADGISIGTGLQNTLDILNIQTGCNVPNTAGTIANGYTLNGYSDWFLPSRDELNLMYATIGQGAPAPLTNVGGFANADYWSSTEGDNVTAWFQHFPSGSQFIKGRGSVISVRAIRAF